MKLPTPGDDGSQPRNFVIQQLVHFGIGVRQLDENLFELTDSDGDMEVVVLKDPVNYRMITHLWRRFGFREGMLLTDFVAPRQTH